jgi:hypothetical protein
MLKRGYKKLRKMIQFLHFFLLFLFISSAVSFVNALNFNLGVHEDQELIWRCNVCNQNEMDLIFGSGWNDSGIFNNLSVGTRMKWKINNVEINESFSKINFSIWFWTSESIWGTKDNDSEILYIFDDLESNFSIYTSLVPFWFPIPIGDYLGSLELNDWYDLDNRVLPTINVDIDEDEISLGIPQRRIKIIAIYNEQGILYSYKLYTAGNVVIVDISLDFLPIYVIPTLIGLLAIFFVSLIIYIYNIRRKR